MRDHIEVEAEHEQRRAARLIQRNAEDADLLMRMLGIRPDAFRVQWARTFHLGAAGYVTLSIDVDVREIQTWDAEFIGRLVSAVDQFAALQETPDA